MSLEQPWVLQALQKIETITFPFQLTTNATVASIRALVPNNTGIYLFSKTDGQTITTYDAAPGFTAADLTDATAPSIFGLIAQVGDALDALTPVGLEILPGASAGATGYTALGTVTLKGANSRGVTATGNISLIFGLTGVDADASTSTLTGLMRLTYVKTQPR